jgi:hypothetical protein
VHRLTEVFDRGEPLDIPPGLEGYLESYAAFLAIVKPVYEASEIAVRSAALGFAGRIDRVCSDLFGTRALLDFKTGVPAPWHGAQLSGYNALHPTGARWACYLGRDGRYALRRYDDPADHRRFMYDLAAVAGTVTAEGDYWHVR